MDLSRAKYILPNAFTLGSVLCATFSMHTASQASTPKQLAMAAWLIIVAALFDMCDGRVARMTKTESDFGVQMDSLADAVSFGVAPAFLLYHWGLSELGAAGVVISFIFMACTLMRLARFNVMAMNQEHDGPSRFFLGLPSPLAAGAVVAVVLAHLSISDQMTTPATTAVITITLLLSGLMVSNVRYRTFKDADWRGREGVVALGLVLATVGIGVAARPSVAVVMLMSLYVALGLMTNIVHVGRSILGFEQDDEAH